MVPARSLSGTITILMAMTNFVSTLCPVLRCSAIQSELAKLGYYRGAIDGVDGDETYLSETY
jgi:hypothetical protein